MIRTKLLVASVFAGVAVLATSCGRPQEVPHVEPVWQFKLGAEYPVISLCEDGTVLAVGAQIGKGSLGPGPPSGSYGGVIEAWDLSKRKRIAQLQIDHGVQSIEFLSGGEEVFVGASNLDADKSPGGSHGSVQVWNVFDKKMTARVDFSEDVYRAAMSPDRSLFCVMRHDKLSTEPQIWCGLGDSLRKGERKSLTLDALDVPIRRASGMAFSSTGLFLFSSDSPFNDTSHNEDLISIWNIKRGERKAGIPDTAGRFGNAISVDDTNGFVAFLMGGGLNISDIEGVRYPQNFVRVIDVDYDHHYAMVCTEFSPTGDYLAVAGGWAGRDRFSDKGTVVLMKLPELEVAGRVRLDQRATTIHSVVFTNDGKQLIAASIDGSVRVWAVADIIEKGG